MKISARLQMFSRPMTRSLASMAILAAAAITATPAQAAFHLWSIRELYSNGSGTVQYIEMFDSFGGQQFVGFQSISVTDLGNTTTHTFQIPSNLGEDSFNRALLFATAGAQAAGGPVPDFILPNGFLFTAGGSISFFGLNPGGYGALPTGGFFAYSYPGGASIMNTPQNFAGQIGQVPEPSIAALLALGAVGFFSARRRGSITRA